MVNKEMEILGRKVTTAELLIQVANTPKGQDAYGDLKEQKLRMDIIDACTPKKDKEGNEKELKNIKLSDAQKELLVSIIKKGYFKVNVIDRELIKFQEDVLRLIE